MNYDFLTKSVENCTIPKMEFYRLVGITASGYSDMIKRKTMKVDTLEKIAEILEIPIQSFFLEKSEIISEPDIYYNTNNWKDKYINCQEEKDRLQQKIIELLSK